MVQPVAGPINPGPGTGWARHWMALALAGPGLAGPALAGPAQRLADLDAWALALHWLGQTLAGPGLAGPALAGPGTGWPWTGWPCTGWARHRLGQALAGPALAGPSTGWARHWLGLALAGPVIRRVVTCGLGYAHIRPRMTMMEFVPTHKTTWSTLHNMGALSTCHPTHGHIRAHTKAHMVTCGQARN
jgi:hypothetical protein